MNLKWYPSKVAAIPSFDFWGLTAMILCMILGVRGLAGLSMSYLALNQYAPYWHVTLIIAPIIYMAGQFMKPPNGLVVSMIGSAIIFVGCIAVYIGLSLAMESWLFSGFGTLLILGIGTAGKFMQMFFQLNTLSRRLVLLNKAVKSDN